MEGRLLSGNGRGLADSYSLAQVRNLDLSIPSAFLTVGKLGSRGTDDQRDQRLIVRIYNPAGVQAGRSPIAVTFGRSGDGNIIQASQLSALEKSITNPVVKIPLLPLGSRTVALTPIRALTTLCASFSGACAGQ
jgi:hypothetical protein